WYAGILVNRSLLGIRMQEISRILDWIKSEDRSIVGMASGVLTTDLLHTAFVREADFQSIVLIDPLESYESLVESADYETRYILSGAEGMLAHYDLDDLRRGFSQTKPVLMINLRNGAGEITADKRPQSRSGDSGSTISSV